jgi:hypothetical protein
MSWIGSLPGNSWGLGMPSLDSLMLQSNSLTGQLPAEWFSSPDVFPKLHVVDLRWNQLLGPVPKSSNGSNADVVLLVAPMDIGFGLCGKAPTPGPVLIDAEGRGWSTNGKEIMAFPQCEQAHHRFDIDGLRPVTVSIMIPSFSSRRV